MEQLPPRHGRDKVWDQLTSCQLQYQNRVSGFCQTRPKFNHHWKCIPSPTDNILPLYFFGGLSSHGPSQAQSNSRQNLKMQISLPLLLLLTGAFLSFKPAKLIQNSHSWTGEKFSCMPGNQMWLHFVAEFKLYNAAGLSTCLVCAEGWKEGKPPNHVTTAI